MTNDSGPPPWPPPPKPPATELDPAPEPRRRGWLRAAGLGGVVILAVAAFFVAKSLAGGGSSPPAAASANNGGSGTSGANNGAGRRFPGTAGQITSINGATLTVKDRQNQSVTVTTSSSTRISVSKTVPLSTIAKGDRITATGQQSGTSITATRIMIADASNNPNGRPGANGGPPSGAGFQRGGFNPPNGSGNGQPPAGFAFGTVTNVSGNTITISSFNGSTMTVTASSSTTVTKNSSGSFSDLKVGQTIRATGATSSNGTVAATAISEGAGGFGFGRRGAP